VRFAARDGLEAIAFERIADEFQMIDSVQMPIIVADDDEGKAAVRSLERAERCGAIARELQPYLVQIPREAHARLAASGAIQPVAPERFGNQFMQLVALGLYDSNYGLRIDPESGLRAEDLIT